MQSLRKSDETIAFCISFKLRMISILVSNYGVNDHLKQALQAITHKLVKSFEHLAYSSENKHNTINLLNLIFKIVLVDVARENLIVFLLGEISKLFKKQVNVPMMGQIYLNLAEQSPENREFTK